MIKNAGDDDCFQLQAAQPQFKEVKKLAVEINKFLLDDEPMRLSHDTESREEVMNLRDKLRPLEDNIPSPICTFGRSPPRPSPPHIEGQGPM